MNTKSQLKLQKYRYYFRIENLGMHLTQSKSLLCGMFNKDGPTFSATATYYVTSFTSYWGGLAALLQAFDFWTYLSAGFDTMRIICLYMSFIFHLFEEPIN